MYSAPRVLQHRRCGIHLKRQTMKKTYITPGVAVMDVAVEGMIATSLDYDNTKKGDGMLSNGKGGWNSEDWSNAEEGE